MKINTTREHKFEFEVNSILGDSTDTISVRYLPFAEKIILDTDEKILQTAEDSFIAVNQKTINYKEYKIGKFNEMPDEYKELEGYITNCFVYEFDAWLNDGKFEKSMIISKRSLTKTQLGIVSAYIVMEEGNIWGKPP